MSVALQKIGTGSDFTPVGESNSWQPQSSEGWTSPSHPQVGSSGCCCSPKPPWGRNFSARGASQLYPKVFHPLRWFLELPALLQHLQLCSSTPDSCAGTCLTFRTQVKIVRDQKPTPHPNVLPGCSLPGKCVWSGHTRHASPHPGMSYPEPWCLHLAFRSCDHPAGLEAAVEQLKGCQLSAPEGFVILGTAVLLPRQRCVCVQPLCWVGLLSQPESEDIIEIRFVWRGNKLQHLR